MFQELDLTLEAAAAVFGKQNLWMVETFAIVFVTLLLALVVAVVLRKAEKRALKTRTVWDDALFGSIRRPAYWIIIILGMASAADIAGQHSESIILQASEHLRYLGAVCVATWFFIGLINRAEHNLMDPELCHKPMDLTTASAVGKLLRISVLITSALIILQYFDVEVSGILAFGGIGGIAVGFAAKDLLANFFGGLMIYMDRPFAVGDWIRSPDKDIEGVVEDIGWRLTRIRTFQKRPLYVPNSTFAQISVENPSRMSHRRIYETIGVRYNDADKLPAILSAVENMLAEHADIEQNLIKMVNFNSFASSSLDFFIYCYTVTTDWAQYHGVKQDVLLKTLAIIEQHDAQCAFPTSTLHIPDGLQIHSKEPAHD